MTPREQTEATIWRVLREVWIRAQGGDPLTLSDAEASGLIDPFTEHMLRHQKILTHVVEQARTQGLEQMHARLHASEGIDHEMLDEAVTFAARWDGDFGDPVG